MLGGRSVWQFREAARAGQDKGRNSEKDIGESLELAERQNVIHICLAAPHVNGKKVGKVVKNP